MGRTWNIIFYSILVFVVARVGVLADPFFRNISRSNVLTYKFKRLTESYAPYASHKGIKRIMKTFFWYIMGY